MTKKKYCACGFPQSKPPHLHSTPEKECIHGGRFGSCPVCEIIKDRDELRALALHLLDITDRSLNGNPPLMKWQDAVVQLRKDLETIKEAKRVLGEKP